MAGDWIKMRTNLWDDPRVMSVCDATGQSEAAVIGGLYWLWATADEHTEDGILPGLSLRTIDRKTGVSGLGAALVSVGWIAESPDGIKLERFDEHNGASAKARAQTAKRVANHKANATVTQQALPEQQKAVSDALPREDIEKRREEVNINTTSTQPVESEKPKSDAARGSRLPKDWAPSDEEIQFCRTERADLDPYRVADRFRDYWHGVAGAKGRKVDWTGTWRNWVRSENVQHQPRGSPSQQSLTFAQQLRARSEKRNGRPPDDPNTIDMPT